MKSLWPWQALSKGLVEAFSDDPEYQPLFMLCKDLFSAFRDSVSLTFLENILTFCFVVCLFWLDYYPCF